MARRRNGWTRGLLAAAFLLGGTLAAQAQSVSMGSSPVFHQGDGVTVLPTVTISCGGSFWSATNDIRLIIPAAVNMEWDTSRVSNATGLSFGSGITPSTVSKVNQTASYPSSKVCIIHINVNFAFDASNVLTPDNLTISGLAVQNFGAPSSATLGAKYDGTNTEPPNIVSVQTLTVLSNPAFITSGANQIISPPGPVTAFPITIQDAAVFPGIRAANNVRITIPAGMNAVWTSAAGTLTWNSVGGSKVSGPVTYQNANKTAVINVGTDFVANDSFTVSNLQFTTIGTDTVSPQRLFVTVNGNSGFNAGNDAFTKSIFGLPTISLSSTSYAKGDPSSNAPDITVTETAGTPKIDGGDDIRIIIPAGLPMTWDTAVTTGQVSVSGSAQTNGHIAAAPVISYENSNKTVVLQVTNAFGAGRAAIIAGLKFANFTAQSVTPLGLDLETESSRAGIEATSTGTIGIGAPTISSAANQTFQVSDGVTNAQIITITDGNPARILNNREIRIKIPAGFNMEFDTTRTSTPQLVFGGSAAGKIVGTNPRISYPNVRTAVVNVALDFAAGETLTINGLRFQNFSAPSLPDNLELEVNNAGTNCNEDNRVIAIGGIPTMVSAANKSFTFGDSSTIAEDIVITDANGAPSITDTGNLRLQIPLGVPMVWDNTVAAVTITGGAAGKVSNAVTYDGTAKTVILNVTADFAINESITIAGLRFRNFTGTVGPTNLGFLVDPVGALIDDSRTVAIGRPDLSLSSSQSFGSGDASTLLNPVTVTEDGTVARLRAATDIRLVIPAGLNLEWDQTVLNLAQISGTGAAHVTSGLSYPNAKTVLISVASDFATGESVVLEGLRVTTFGAASGPLGIDLNASNLGTTCRTSFQTLTVGNRPDLIANVLTRAVTADADGNGAIDRLILTFDTNINGGTTSVTNGVGFTIVNSSSAVPYGIVSGNATGAVVTFTLVETGAAGTDDTPIVTYNAAVGNLVDSLNGLETKFTGPVNATDKAAPVIIAVQGADTDGNGRLNTLTFTFSEALAPGDEDKLDWTIIDADGVTKLHFFFQSILINGNQIIFTLDNAHGSTGTPRYVYDPVVNGADLQDLNANFAVVQTNNTTPFAKAGSDIALAPSRATLDASASFDPDGQPISFAWTQTGGAGVTLDDPASPTPTFIARAAGVYTFQVSVSDGLASATDTMNVTILNVPPTVDAGSIQTVRPGDTAFVVALASTDANGDSLTYTFTQLPAPAGGVTVTAFLGTIAGVRGFTVPTPTLPAPVAGPDNIIRFRVDAFDGVNTSSAIAVFRVNGPATLAPTADAGPDQVAFVGTPVALDGSRSTGTGLTFNWVSTTPLTFGVDPAKPSFTPSGPGLYLFQLTVQDSLGLASLPSTVKVLVQTPGNQAPAAVANKLTPSGAVLVGDLVTLDATGSSDPEGVALNYAWLQTKGPSTQLSNPTVLRPTFTPVQPGTYGFSLIVGDGTNLSPPTSVVVVVKQNISDVTPTVTAALTPGLDPNNDGRILRSAGPITMTGATNSPTTYFFYWSQTAGPAVSFEPLYFGNPHTTSPAFTATLPGLYSFELASTENVTGVRVTTSLSFVVDDDVSATNNFSPTADAGTDQTVGAGSTVTLSAIASSDDTTSIGANTLLPYWTQKSGPPVVISNPYAASPTFTPITGGVYVFELKVTDGTAQSAPDNVQVFVAPNTTVASGGGGGGGCGSTGLEWMLLLPVLWGGSAIRRRLRK